VSLLDRAVGGAAPRLGLVLVGETGTGRTVLCLEVAASALERGQRVVYLTGEPPEILLRQAESLGLDLLPGLSLGRMTLLELAPNASTTTRAHGVGPLLESMEVEAPHADWLIIDPLTSLTADLLDERPLRDAVGSLLMGYGDEQLIMATADTDMLRRQPALERALSDVCGSLAYLRRDEEGRRSISVLKSRFSSSASGKLGFSIGSSGTSPIEPSPAEREAMRARTVADRADSRPRESENFDTRPLVPAELPIRKIEIGGMSPANSRSAEPPAPVQLPPAVAAKAPVVATVEASGRRRILIVHADPGRASQIASVLEPAYETVVEHTAFGALSAIFTQAAALIILDFKLPDISGYEFLATLRKAPHAPPVLAVSESLVRAGDRIRALVLGAADVLPSFCANYELLHKVETILRAPPVVETGGASELDVRELLALASTGSRKIDRDCFAERVERAYRFGERFGIASCVVALETGTAEDLEIVLSACEKLLRTEDAMIQVDDRRAVLLLVAAGYDSVPVVIGRLKKSVERMVDLAWGAQRVATELVGIDDWIKYVEQMSLEVW